MWENEKEKKHKQEKGRESVSATLSLFGRRNVEEVKNIAASMTNLSFSHNFFYKH